MTPDRSLRGHLIAMLIAVSLTVHEWRQGSKAGRDD